MDEWVGRRSHEARGALEGAVGVEVGKACGAGLVVEDEGRREAESEASFGGAVAWGVEGEGVAWDCEGGFVVGVGILNVVACWDGLDCGEGEVAWWDVERGGKAPSAAI